MQRLKNKLNLTASIATIYMVIKKESKRKTCLGTEHGSAAL
jgi:hypothetical protein